MKGKYQSEPMAKSHFMAVFTEAHKSTTGRHHQVRQGRRSCDLSRIKSLGKMAGGLLRR